MDNSVGVQVPQRSNYLRHVALDLDFSQAFAPFDQFVQRLDLINKPNVPGLNTTPTGCTRFHGPRTRARIAPHLFAEATCGS
jgi:hypothetical protein